MAQSYFKQMRNQWNLLAKTDVSLMAVAMWRTKSVNICSQRLLGAVISAVVLQSVFHPVLWGSPVLAQASTDAGVENVGTTDSQVGLPMIGVVQNRDNISHWPTIMARLNQANVDYHVVDWSSVRRQTDLSSLSILILPNIKGVSSGQSAALQEFVAQGGQLIVSGAFGTDATSAVQQQLRSLVGAYWAFTLPQPTVLYPTTIRELEDLNSKAPMRGGVIVPTGLQSDTLATWQESVQVSMPNRPGTTEVITQGAPAVVSTDQTTFLGWNWGHGDADTDFDGIWMGLTIDRHRTSYIAQQTSRPANRLDSEATDVPSASTLLAQDVPQLTTATPEDLAAAGGTGSASVPVPVPVTRPRNHPQPVSARPASAPAPAQASAPTPAPAPVQATLHSPALAASPARSLPTLLDPTTQVAPPGINVGTGSLPITALEAIAMRQELKNLIGRFESALLSANAIHYDPYFSLEADSLAEVSQSSAVPSISEAVSRDSETSSLAQTSISEQASISHQEQEMLLASSTPSQLGLGKKSTGNATLNANGSSMARADGNAQAILQQVQTLVDGFSEAIDQRDYGTARQRWLEARQLLWDNFPSDRPIAHTEIRAMWFDRGTIVEAGSRQGLAEIFDRLAASGINTVFFETVNAGYPIYPSDVAPEQNPLIPESWDPLADAVDLAHERGLELHAWVWTFAAGNQRHNTLVNLPRSYPGPILDHYPGWANSDDRGRTIPVGQDKPFLDPANREVRGYLQDLYTEIVTKYDVDGLQLDYIRYPFQDPSAGRSYGYGQASRRQFRRQTGIDPLNISPANGDLWQAWTEFRIGQVDSFVTEISDHLHRLRPELIMSAAVFPMDPHERMQKLQQNWEAWAQQGSIDLIVTMSYAMDANRLQQLTAPWVTANPAADTTDIGPAILLPGIRLLDLPDSSAIDQIQALRDMPAGGYALFAVENLNDNPNLQTIFNRTQGDRPLSSSPIPYRQPFDSALERFDALNREWNFALSTDQLWLREDARVELHRQSQTLQQSLQALADSPSNQQLAQTKQDLDSFQSQFDDWMALHALENEYRVQTWTNHLAVVQQLLEYGEHQRSL
ncbi:MAG: family 10 glycosylhydrolase [Cyanobacteria bacterium P01_F01_bin.150]